MDVKRATREAVLFDLESYSYAQLEKYWGVNRGLIWRVAKGQHSPTVAAAYGITSEPAGVKQWKARVSQDLFDKLAQVQQLTGLTRVQLLERWAAQELEKEKTE